MTRILHLISTYQLKTDTRWLAKLLTKLDRQRFQCHCAAFYDDGPARGVLESAGATCHFIDAAGWLDPKSLLTIRSLVKRHEIDLIHTHLLRADIFGGIAGKLTATPVVSTVYALGDFRRQYRRPMFDRLLDQLAAAWPKRFIAVCGAIRDDLVSRVGVKRSRIEVIQTGCDPIVVDDARKQRAAERWALTSARPKVLLPARLSYEKGVDVFMRAARRLIDAGVNAEFIIAGDGPQAAEIKCDAASLGFDEASAQATDRGVVRFLGFVDDIEAVMAVSDMVVISSHSEGLPNVAVEAFAVGRTLLATRVGGLTDLEAMNAGALTLVPAGDATALADGVAALLNDSARRERQIRAGHSIIEQHLNTAEVARKYERFYAECSSGR